MSGYIGNIPVPQATQTRQSFTATASQTTFNTAGYSVGYVDVFLNGVKLAPADYTATNGSDIILAVGAASGDILEIVAYEIFQVVDQDFTGDFTVDGSTFVVDSTNNNVGIGTSSPARKFEVHGTSSESNRLISVEHTGADYAFITFSDQNTTDDGSVRVGGLGNDLIAFAGGSERMRIDSSGNVGIGTAASGGVKLDVSGTIRSTVSGGTPILYLNNGTTQISISNSSGAMTFASDGGSERMRIDGSGNLLVGKTASSLNNDGFQAHNTGYIGSTNSGASTAYFNRKTDDGDIVNFQKDGTTVGSIGTLSSRLHIENGDTGLRIAGDLDQIFPCGSGGADRGSAIDLGSSGVKFKDLYLSGGILADGISSVSTIREKVTVTLTTSGTINADLLSGAVVYFSANQLANRTINFRGDGSNTLNSIMDAGQSVTFAALMAQGSTAYYLNAYQVDGTSVTPKWSGGSAPTGGNASSLDVYTFTIIKTASATFTVLASLTQYA